MTNAFAAPRVARRGHGAADPAPAHRDVLALSLAGIADGWLAWTRYRELRAMGDAGLARLGTTRGDAARHAVFGTAGEGRRDG